MAILFSCVSRVNLVGLTQLVCVIKIYVTDELIRREVLCKHYAEKPLTNGVFCVDGKYTNP